MALLALRLYLILNAEAELGEETPKYTLEDFGSNMILIGELFLCSMIMFQVVVCGINLDDFIYLSNQLFAYNKAVLEMRKSKNIAIDAEHRRGTLMLDLNIYGSTIGSLILPFGVAACILHPMEPNHRIAEDWFELEVGLHNWFTLAWYAVTCIGLTGCGNIIIILSWNIAMYFLIANTCLEDITPDQVEQCWDGKRCSALTHYYGVMEDQEIVNMYRIQKLFNTLMNNFYSSVLISFHHVAVLAVVSIMIFFAIKFQDIIWDGGIIVEGVVLSTIFTGMIIIKVQSMMCGYLVDVSENFRDRCKKVVRGKYFLRKSAESCDTFHIQVAYPFYTVDKGTFVNFCSQVQDYAITLLLW
ncbi:unnamed protein product [Orchesella dallaii]|uniref:Odorant receptor n=1 Tax=Orchesella dallaii TaxID=48710 RepID=A0ABP1RGZ1_9HEXA